MLCGAVAAHDERPERRRRKGDGRNDLGNKQEICAAQSWCTRARRTRHKATAKVYDIAATVYFGDFAKLNFMTEVL